MITNLDATRLAAAYEKARLELLRERNASGHWVGRLATSALSTATAVSALSLVRRHGQQERSTETHIDSDQSDLSRIILRGIHWLADHQNPDGGWGDTDRSYSNISTTMLAVSAFHLTGVPADHEDLLDRANRYIASQGGVVGLRQRYGRDKTFAVPILTNSALAGIVPWREVPALPFEFACLPQEFYRFVQLPVVSYAIPALVAIGQARFFHRRPWNPLLRLLRNLAISPSLRVLDQMQPASGGYLEAVPLTSFVVMSLASTGRVSHSVTRLGVQFLLESMRADGSWPIDTNLATWNTTLAANALVAASPEETDEYVPLDWLLSCQHRERHPFTGAQPGGWGWSDLSGAVPDADDTPSALLTLASHLRHSHRLHESQRAAVLSAAAAGCQWLLDLQNRDGGWPTFCRGWGKLPFDRSGADLTAHAMRALHAWRHLLDRGRLGRALRRGFDYLATTQAADGSWVPLWFGNQDRPAEENPIYGTARVLLAYRDLQRVGLDSGETTPAQRGWMYLRSVQNKDGGWGGGPSLAERFGSQRTSSVEETALAVEALLCRYGDAEFQPVIVRGLRWLIDAVESGHYTECSPIGFYFAKLWYYEKLYPLIFTVSALGHACRYLPACSAHESATAHLAC